MPQAGVFIEGGEFTRSGGTFTFAPYFWGWTVRITYQVLEPSLPWVSALGKLGLDLATGAMGQPVWSHLSSNHSAQAIGYSGVAYVYAAAYDLSSDAQIENHNFEVSTQTEFSSTIPDANMAVVVQQFLTDGQRGVQWPAAYLAPLTDYSAYVVSHGLFMSPVLEAQAPAAETLRRWLMLTNSDCVMSGTQLKVVPLGDESKTANGATYTANTTPVYDLGPDDLLNEGQPRVRMLPRANEDAFNVVRVEYRNRANGYAIDIAEARDRAHIDIYGEKVKEVIKAHEICTPEVAGQVAQMELQRQMAVWADYEFSLPWTKGRLEPLDLLTLTTDDDLGLVRQPVRITSITEAEAGQFDLVAEDAPIGMASAPLFGVQSGAGYQPDYNVAPGSVDAPLIFEAPAELAGGTGLEVYAAVRGSGANWGGCQVWVSLDGSNYQLMATVNGGARYGTLSAWAAADATSISVQGLGSAQLLPAGAADAAALATLCYVGGTFPEYLAYQTASFTGPGAYTLGALVHSAYGTVSNVHNAGAPFARVDDRIAKSGPLEISYVGKTLYFKFCSFNAYGAALQSLADVSAYSYIVTGGMAAVAPYWINSVVLKASMPNFPFTSPTATTTTAPDVVVTATKKGVTGASVWTANAYDATGTRVGALDAVTLTDVFDLTATLTSANFNALDALGVRRVVITCTAGIYSDSVTVFRVDDGAPGSTGSPGTSGTIGGTAYLWQWSTGTPADPTGTSIFTWATFTNGTYTGGAGWQTTVPSNPGTPGAKLWNAAKGASASAGSSTTSVSWASGFSKTAWSGNGLDGGTGSPGASGVQSADAVVYRWDATIPSGPTGSATYTWATRSFGAAPTTPVVWSLTPGTSPSPGYTLWAALVPLVDSAANATTGFNWSSAGITARGSAGSDGGDAAAYSLVTSTKVVQKSVSGAYTPSAVTFSALISVGASAPGAYAGRFVVATSTDGSTYTTTYTSGADESATTYTVPAGIKTIRVRLYLGGGTSTLLDETVIPIVSDGAVGADGLSAITVVAPNLSHGLPASNAGVVSDYTGSGTTIEVYEGTTQLTYRSSLTAVSSFTVGSGVVVPTGAITPGSFSGAPGTTATGGVHSAASDSVDVMTITWLVTARRANGVDVYIPVTQSLSKSKAGPSGGTGQQGASARIAYTVVASSNTPAASPNPLTVTGDVLPSANTWGMGETWGTTVPSYTAGQTVYQTDAIYNPASGNTVWGLPYMSTLKVGSLSAITTNTGALSVTGDLTMSATSAIRAGAGTYGTAGGWFAGYHSGAYKLSLGDKLLFDGTNLAVKGNILGGAFTSYLWPAAGSTGYYLGNGGLLLGNNNDPSNTFWLEVNVGGGGAGGHGFLSCPGMYVDGAGAIFSGSVKVGTTPAISGTTMTGSGGVINSSGTFALGNSTTNISFNGTTLTLNGAIVTAANLNLAGFTASISGTTSLSISATGVQVIGTPTCSASGGSGSLTYAWSIVDMGNDLGNTDNMYLTGTLTSATVGLSGRLSTTSPQNVLAMMTCIVTDATGRTVTATHSASLTHP